MTPEDAASAKVSAAKELKFTHDQGIHDRLDKIIIGLGITPTKSSAWMAQAILKAGLDRGVLQITGGGEGGGQMIITNAPTVSNTSYVDQTVSTKRHLPNLSAIS